MNYVSSFYSTLTTLVDVSFGHVHASSYFSVARVRYTVLDEKIWCTPCALLQTKAGPLKNQVELLELFHSSSLYFGNSGLHFPAGASAAFPKMIPWPVIKKTANVNYHSLQPESGRCGLLVDIGFCHSETGEWLLPLAPA